MGECLSRDAVTYRKIYFFDADALFAVMIYRTSGNAAPSLHVHSTYARSLPRNLTAWPYF